VTPQNPDYPVRLDIDYPDRLSRLLIFVKWLLAIPHYVVLIVLGIGAYVVLIVSWFAVLITGTYPVGMFNYMVGFERWRARVSAYLLLQTDRYPPFSLADDPSYPVRLEVDYPQRIARWRPLLNWLLAIPAFVAVFVLGIIAEVAVLIAWFAILITGRYPQGLFDAVTIALRWTARTTIFAYWMTESYPPFVWA
jgi:Domain of unknown function (DUF4389)